MAKLTFDQKLELELAKKEKASLRRRNVELSIRLHEITAEIENNEQTLLTLDETIIELGTLELEEDKKGGA